MDFKLIVVAFCCLSSRSTVANQQLNFARMLSVYDAVYQYVFTAMSSRSLESKVDCASWALQTSTLATKSQRASAFIFNRSSSTCTLGRTLAYNDHYVSGGVLPQADSEAYVLLQKPLGSAVNSDTWFYALLNEEQSAYFSHPNFIMAWPTGSPPNWSLFSYAYQSPVQTYGGMYGMMFPASTGLEFTAAAYPNAPGISFLVWYMASSSTNVPLASVCGSYGELFEFWQYFSPYRASLSYQPSSGTWLNQYANAGTAVVGVWKYIGVTYDIASSANTFYFNGTKSGSGSMSFLGFGSFVSQVLIGSNCGRSSFLSGGGALASVEIYMRALNDTEVAQAMTKSYTSRTQTGMLPV